MISPVTCCYNLKTYCCISKWQNPEVCLHSLSSSKVIDLHLSYCCKIHVKFKYTAALLSEQGLVSMSSNGISLWQFFSPVIVKYSDNSGFLLIGAVREKYNFIKEITVAYDLGCIYIIQLLMFSVFSTIFLHWFFQGFCCYEHLIDFHWNFNFKSKAKRVLMASVNWDREELICCLFVHFPVYHLLPCRYLIEGPLIIDMDWYHCTPGTVNSGTNVLGVSRGIDSILAWIIKTSTYLKEWNGKKKITQTSFSCSKWKTRAGAHNVFKMLIDSNKLVSSFSFIWLIRW